MEAQTSQHDILSSIQEINFLRGCCNTTSNGLEEQTNEVAGAENDGVDPRSNRGQVCAINDDNPRETEIDGSTQESGSDGKSNKVDQERIAVERVEVHPETANIANDFKELGEFVRRGIRIVRKTERNTKPKNIAAMYPHVL